MKVLRTDAQVWWVALADEIRPVKSPPPGAVMEAVKTTFQFAVIPTAFKVGEGLEFQQGTLALSDRLVVISKLVLFSDGINITVPTTTDDADIVLEKILEIIASFGFREPLTPPSHSYVNWVVADFDCSIDSLFPPSLLEEIEKAIPRENKPSMHALSLAFQFDPAKLDRRPLAGANAGFRIERREEFPYESNRYFSVANMTTDNHVALLERFEFAAKERAAR